MKEPEFDFSGDRAKLAAAAAALGRMTGIADAALADISMIPAGALAKFREIREIGVKVAEQIGI